MTETPFFEHGSCLLTLRTKRNRTTKLHENHQKQVTSTKLTNDCDKTPNNTDIFQNNLDRIDNILIKQIISMTKLIISIRFFSPIKFKTCF